jgi:hypothetical protein
MAQAPKQVHLHDLNSIALNYPCPVGQLRVVRHKRTKCRKSGTREQNCFLSMITTQVYNTLFGSRMETGPPSGAWGAPSTLFTFDGGRSQISDIAS